MRSELTEAEIYAASHAECDLAAGYPRIMLPQWLNELAADGTLGEAALRDYLAGAGAGEALDRRLLDAVLDRLGADRAHGAHGFITHSGSVALNRALASIEAGHVVVTSPTIDIVPAFLNEFRHLTVTAVDHDPASGAYDVDRILAAVTRRPGASCWARRTTRWALR